MTSGCGPVDVAVQVYGKPFQTAVTLLSLVQESGRHLGRIFLVLERVQPAPMDLRPLLARLPAVHVWRPWVNFGYTASAHPWLFRWFAPYRKSIRYQYAWEESRSRYLLILHNDMLFHGDLVGAYLDRIEDALAIGQVGQCWNCSASMAGLCSPDRYERFRPSREELAQVYTKHPSPRQERYAGVMTEEELYGWPLPECRLNEFAAMIDLERARTVPDVPYFGAFDGVDIGSRWFAHVVRRGHRVAHLDFNPWATHAWATGGIGGHAGDRDRNAYERSEAIALEHLRTHYGWA